MLQLIQRQGWKDRGEHPEQGLHSERKPSEGRHRRHRVQMQLGKGISFSRDRLLQRRDTFLFDIGKPMHEDGDGHA